MLNWMRSFKVMSYRIALLVLACGALCPPAQAQESAVPKPDAAKQLSEAQKKLKKLSATEYDLDGIHINAATREVRVPTIVNIKKAPVEYMLVHETGKTHESILSTKISPTSVQVALLLANYEPATEGMLTTVPQEERPKIWKEEPPKTPRGNRLRLTVEWKAGTETKRAPFSNWVQNVETRKPPPDLDTWIFNGSFVDERGFAAQAEGSIVGIWLDRTSIVNSPAKGNWRDELWISKPDSIPDEGTPVTLIFSPEKAASPSK